MLRFFLCAAAIAAASCNAPAGGESAGAATTHTAVAPAADGLIPGTPAGDLGDWVNDIRSGIRDAMATAAADAPAAQRAVLELYVTRQEYAEMYYGVDGRLPASAGLAAAVDSAEVRFHDLMKLLNTAAPDPGAVRAAADALDSQQQEVARLWKQGDVRLERPSR